MSTASLTISCDDCVMHHSDACEDCVVTYLCSSDPVGEQGIDEAEARAVRLLSNAGLAPRLRHQRRAS